MSGSGSSYGGIRTGCSCRHVHPGGSLLSRALRTSLMEKPCSALLAIFVTMKPSISSTLLGSFNDPDAMIRSYSSTVMRRGVNGAKVGGGDTIGCVGVTVDMVTTLSPHRPSTAPILPSARGTPWSGPACWHIVQTSCDRLSRDSIARRSPAFAPLFISFPPFVTFLAIAPTPTRLIAHQFYHRREHFASTLNARVRP